MTTFALPYVSYFLYAGSHPSSRQLRSKFLKFMKSNSEKLSRSRLLKSPGSSVDQIKKGHAVQDRLIVQYVQKIRWYGASIGNQKFRKVRGINGKSIELQDS